MANIVLIEDNIDLREMLTESLTASGHNVWAARDARTGVNHCEHSAPDLVVTDLMVPNSEDLDRLEALRQTAAVFQVVVISGALDSPESAERAARLAGTNVLAKPFRARELVRLAEELLASSVIPAG